MIAILLLDIQLINLLLFPSFPNSHHLHANFPNYKRPWHQIQMSRKITGKIKSGVGHEPYSTSKVKHWQNQKKNT
jgi:hypothetical protein